MFTETINGVRLVFETSGDVFSPCGVDRGTLAMLQAARMTAGDKLLDLGCGYGAVGIYAAKLIGGRNVVMSDSDENCAGLARTNAALNGVGEIKIIVSDAFTKIDDMNFTLILSNPPYHADFSTPKRFIEKGFNRLAIGGRMYMVTKRMDWYKNKLTAIFGGVSVTRTDGYCVFCAEKRSARYANSNK